MYMNSYWKQKERLRAKAKKNIEMIIKGETKQMIYLDVDAIVNNQRSRIASKSPD